MFARFKEYLKIRDVCIYFQPYFKVHNLVSVQPKSIILNQTSNQIVCFKDEKRGSEIIVVLACLRENARVGIKKSKN